MAVWIPVLCCDLRAARAQDRVGIASATDQGAVFDPAGDDMRFAQVPTPPMPRIPPNPVQPNQIPPTRPTTPPPNRPNPNLVQPSPPAAGPSANALAYNSASTASNATLGLAGAPNMFGDSLGFPFFFTVQSDIGAGGRIVGNIPIAAGDGPTKIADDTSPLPMDRVFFDYNFFNNALLTANGDEIGLNRYSFGIEKTFFDGNASVEIKAPVDAGLNDFQDVAANTLENEGTVFGNLAIVPKVLLYSDGGLALAGGMAIGAPTAPNGELHVSSFQDIRIKNQSVHLSPFVGMLVVPRERLFSISYLQFDFDANGDPVDVIFGPQIFHGRLRDPTLMYADVSIGYWLYRDDLDGGGRRFLTGVAPIVELHYTTTLQDAQGFQAFGSGAVPLQQRIDVLNLTAGLQFQLGSYSFLSVAGVAPLRTEPGDKQFDAEVVVQFNRRF